MSPRRRRRVRLAVLGAACATLLALVPALVAQALTTSSTPTPVTGNATWFDALGSPYGGCGLPQANLDSQNFVALNVYNTPGDYSFYPRPLAGADLAKMGMWDNGHNCGRYVQVSIGDYCTGTNDGAPNQAFCRGGAYQADAYNGGTLTMLVADSCGDSNAWCRDDPYHLDLAKGSLNSFVKNGSTLTDLYPAHWNNRHVSWTFVPAPNYTGDINIGFIQGAQRWWPAIAVSHLANGIHSVEYYADGAWHTAQMNGDMGQSHILSGLTAGDTNFQIRVRDANDQLINGGRVYSFSLPASCGSNCSAAYTATSYTTSSGSASASPSASASASPSSSPSASVSPSRSVSASPSASASSSPSTGARCTATYSITGQWSGGFQGGVTVTAGSALTGWRVTWNYANGQVVSQGWSATITQSGTAVTATNLSWNGTLAAGSSTSFGFLASWNGTNAVPALTCTAT